MIAVKTARCARASRGRFAPVLSVIIPGKIPAAYQEDGEDPMSPWNGSACPAPRRTRLAADEPRLPGRWSELVRAERLAAGRYHEHAQANCGQHAGLAQLP